MSFKNRKADNRADQHAPYKTAKLGCSLCVLEAVDICKSSRYILACDSVLILRGGDICAIYMIYNFRKCLLNKT